MVGDAVGAVGQAGEEAAPAPDDDPGGERADEDAAGRAADAAQRLVELHRDDRADQRPGHAVRQRRRGLPQGVERAAQPGARRRADAQADEVARPHRAGDRGAAAREAASGRSRSRPPRRCSTRRGRRACGPRARSGRGSRLAPTTRRLSGNACRGNLPLTARVASRSSPLGRCSEHMTNAIRILGLDPGLRRTGWGVVVVDGARLAHVAHGVIAAPETRAAGRAAAGLFDGRRRGHRALRARRGGDRGDLHDRQRRLDPEARPRPRRGDDRAGRAPACRSPNTPPRWSRRRVVGTGGADKRQVAFMVARLLPTAGAPTADAADALAVAIAHAHARARPQRLGSGGMIGRLRGVVAEIGEEDALIDVGGRRLRRPLRLAHPGAAAAARRRGAAARRDPVGASRPACGSTASSPARSAAPSSRCRTIQGVGPEGGAGGARRAVAGRTGRPPRRAATRRPSAARQRRRARSWRSADRHRAEGQADRRRRRGRPSTPARPRRRAASPPARRSPP